MSTRTRIAVSLVVLAAVWGIAFNVAALPFFVVVTVGGVLAGAAGLWVRSSVGRPLPTFRLTAGSTRLAAAVAVAHYLVGWGAFSLAAVVAPTLGETAVTVYGLTATGSSATQLVLGAAITAPLEEILWRGAVHPVIATAVRDRWHGRRGAGVLALAVSVAVYASWHLATLQVALVAAAALGGLVWGWLVERTNSVGAVMLAHGLWTGLMLAFPVL